MKVATAEQMRQIDHKAITEYKLAGLVLMENAGRETAQEVENMLGCLNGKKITIFCGKGNNGGDGYVAARHLLNRGATVRVFALGEKSAVAGDAKVNMDILLAMGVDVFEIQEERDWHRVRICITFADGLVDALLGTGFQGDVREPMAQLITIMNQSGKPVVAVDLPSGVEADTGQVGTVAVRAQRTITFGLPKPGHFLYPGADYTGKLRLDSIGLPGALLTDKTIHQNWLTMADIRARLPVRADDAHKGSCGHVCVIAGSRGLTGAAVLASTGALRAGAGLVTLGIASSLHDLMEIKLTEVMTRPLPETPAGAIGAKAVPYILQLLEKMDVLAIGPGLGTAEETIDAVREIVRISEIPMVIDADALNALAGYRDLLLQANALAVLTPHPGEMARLIGVSPADINRDRLNIARDAAVGMGSIVVLKGAPTIIAYPDGETYINSTGNPGMATGGMGDALTGIIAALIGQGLSSHDAAIAGVYLHGLAGDIAARQGEIGIQTGDLLQAVPLAIQTVLSEN